MKKSFLLLLLLGFFGIAKSNMPPPMYEITTALKFTHINQYPDVDFYILFNDNKKNKLAENKTYILNANKTTRTSRQQFSCRVFFQNKSNKAIADTIMLYGERSYGYNIDYYMQKTIQLSIENNKIGYDEIEVKKINNTASKTKKQKSNTFMSFPTANGNGGNTLLIVLSFLSMLVFTLLFLFRQKRLTISNV